MPGQSLIIIVLQTKLALRPIAPNPAITDRRQDYRQADLLETEANPNLMLRL
jgi:hypothetical protein